MSNESNFTVFFDNLQVVHKPGPIEEETHYYPFGLTMNGISSKGLIGLTNNKLKFNGKEEQRKEFNDGSGLDWLDYGARFYDNQIGRWCAIDLLLEEFYNISPFVFVENNSIRLADEDGKAPSDIVILGKNNSSVTINTDLIDVKVNASGLGVNFGGKFSLEGESIISAGLDLAGVIDPTGVADGLNAGLQAKKGDWLGAGISALGLIPYVGDLAKIGKVNKDVKILENAIETINLEKKTKGSYTVVFGSGKKYHGKGTVDRMEKSAIEKSKKYNDPVKSKDWTSAKNDREAFKQESKRLHTDVGGHKSQNNYNIRDSPGTKYRKIDGD